MRRLLSTLLLAVGIMAGSLAFSPAASAQFDPLDKACSGDASNSAACQDRDDADSITGSNGIIARVTNIVALAAGVVAVIVMIIYGIMIIVSYGESGKVTQARNAIIGAAVGLVVVVLARTIIVFILDKL
jgi:type IV secretion system pilin